MRKLLRTCVSIALASAMVINSTVPYRAHADAVENTVDVTESAATVGLVRFTQHEQQRETDESGNYVVDENGDYAGELVGYTQAQPLPAVYLSEQSKHAVNVNGYEIQMRDESVQNYVDKIVTVENTGNKAAYVRTIIAIPTAGYDSGGIAANEWLHWNAVSDQDTVQIDGSGANGWMWGLETDDGNHIEWPSNTQEWDVVKDVAIGGLEYDLYITTNKNIIAPGEKTAPNLVGFYLDSRVSCEILEDGTWNYYFIIDDTRYELGDVSNLNIYVTSQMVQAEGFSDAWTALNTAFGKITAENNPIQVEFTQSILEDASATLESEDRVACLYGNSDQAQREANALYYLTLVTNLATEGTAETNVNVGENTFGFYTDTVIDYVEFLMSGNTVPTPSGGLPWEHAIIAASLVLIKNTSVIWEGLEETTREKIDWLMKGLAIAGNWCYNDANDYYTGLNMSGNFRKGWNPNYKNTYLSIVLSAAMYFGSAELDEIFVGFDYDEYIEKYTEYGYTKIVEAWAKAGKDRMENGGEDGLGGSGAGVKIPFKLKGKGLDDLENIIAYLINDTYAKQSSTAATDEETGETIYEISVEERLVTSMIETQYDFVPNETDEEGNVTQINYDCYTVSGASSPYEGQVGMMTELSIANRSSLGYSSHSFEILTAVVANLKLLGYWDDFSTETENLENRMHYGNLDFLFKMGEGWFGCKANTRLKTYGYELNDRGLPYAMDIWYKYHLGYSADTVLFTEPDEGYIPDGVWKALDYAGAIPAEAYHDIGKELTSGTVSFDLTLGEKVTPEFYDACIVLDNQENSDTWAQSKMIIQLQSGKINVYNSGISDVTAEDTSDAVETGVNAGYKSTGLTFGANDTFHVEMDFDVTAKTYVVRLTNTDTGESFETAVNRFRESTGAEVLEYVSALAVVKSRVDATVWVDNFVIEAESVTISEYDDEAPIISGIINGYTYCVSPELTVTDRTLTSVTVNGEAIELNDNGTCIYNLPMLAGTQEIVATDKTGNKSSVTVRVTDTIAEDISLATGTFTVGSTTSSARKNLISFTETIDLSAYQEITLNLTVDFPDGYEATGSESGRIVFFSPAESDGDSRYFALTVPGITEGTQEYTLVLTDATQTRNPFWTEITTVRFVAAKAYGASLPATTKDADGNIVSEGAVVTINSAKLIAQEEVREHTFDQQIQAEAYLVSEGDCITPATYYYSCACGAVGTAIFAGEENTDVHVAGCTITYTDKQNGTTHKKEYSECLTMAEEAHVPSAENAGTCNLCGGRIMYTVAFVDHNGETLSGEAYGSLTLQFGETITVPAEEPERESDDTYAYAFVGWKLYDVETGMVGEKLMADMTATGNATYMATYVAYDKNIANLLFATRCDDLNVNVAGSPIAAGDISKAAVNDFTNVEITTKSTTGTAYAQVVNGSSDAELKAYGDSAVGKNKGTYVYLDREINISGLESLTIELTVKKGTSNNNNSGSAGCFLGYDAELDTWSEVVLSDSSNRLFAGLGSISKNTDYSVKIVLMKNEDGSWNSTYLLNNVAQETYSYESVSLPETVRFRLLTSVYNSNHAFSYDDIFIYGGAE